MRGSATRYTHKNRLFRSFFLLLLLRLFLILSINAQSVRVNKCQTTFAWPKIEKTKKEKGVCFYDHLLYMHFNLHNQKLSARFLFPSINIIVKAQNTMTCDLMSSVFFWNASLCEEDWPDTVDLASSPSPTAPINEAHIWPWVRCEPVEPLSLLGGGLMGDDLSEVISVAHWLLYECSTL